MFAYPSIYTHRHYKIERWRKGFRVIELAIHEFIIILRWIFLNLLYMLAPGLGFEVVSGEVSR